MTTDPSILRQVPIALKREGLTSTPSFAWDLNGLGVQPFRRPVHPLGWPAPIYANDNTL